MSRMMKPFSEGEPGSHRDMKYPVVAVDSLERADVCPECTEYDSGVVFWSI